MLKKFTLTIFSALCLLATDGIAQNASRLIATHTIRFNTSWEPTDSTNIKYSNGNGGDYWDLIGHKLKFDTVKRVGWNGTAWQAYRTEIQTFNAQNKVTELLHLNTLSGTPVNDNRTVYTYNAGGDLTEELEQDWVSGAWVNTFRLTRTFDANHNMLVSNSQYWSTATNNWGSSYLLVYTYAANNNIMSMVNAALNLTTMQYDSNYRYVYHYNSNNQQDTSLSYSWSNGWIKMARATSIYTATTTSYDYLLENWDATANAWVNSLRGFALYNANNVANGDSTQTWHANTSSWVNFSLGRNKIDANGNAIEYLFQMYDTIKNAFVNNYIDSSAHNSFHQITWTKRQSWDTLNQKWTGKYAFTDNLYYYELYTSGVKNTAKDAGLLTLYPIPARSMLNIDMQWNKAQDFVVAIYDMQGRLLKQWGEKAMKTYKNAIPVRDLTAGTYIIEIRGTEARTQQQFIVQ